MSDSFSDLGDAIADERFVDVDLALRRGQHIPRDDADWYQYLLDAQVVLEVFYRRYGCELVHRSDGYFFLLPTGDKVSKRLLGLPEMIVGQCAALLYLDPATVESGGVITKDDLVSHLAAVLGTNALVGVFNPKRKRLDERLAQETVRQRIAEGLRKLAQLGFVSLSEDNRIHLRSALMRFADPVRGAGSPTEALEKLIARGEVSIPEENAPDGEGAPEGPTAELEDDDGEGELFPKAAATPEVEAAPKEADSRGGEHSATEEPNLDGVITADETVHGPTVLPIATRDEDDAFDPDDGLYPSYEEEFDDPYARYESTAVEDDGEPTGPDLGDLLGETDEAEVLGFEAPTAEAKKAPKKQPE